MFFYLLVEGMLLVGIVYILFSVMFLKMDKDNELMSSYECGFDINSFTRLAFSYRFFLISILFIIFDVEVSLILPLPFLCTFEDSLMIFFLFMMILVMGLFYEYKYGSLDWLDIN